MKKYSTTRHLARAILALLVAIVASTNAWAQDLPTFSGGSGTSDDPYKIATADDLKALANAVNNNTEYSKGKYFIQTADITLDGTTNNFAPIGNTSYRFYGNYNGNKLKISGINIDGTGQNLQYVGVFGYVSSIDNSNEHYIGTIQNLTVDDCTFLGYREVGGIAGCNRGSIDNCTVTSTVSLTAARISDDPQYFGGIAGLTNGGSITNCTSSVSISVSMQSNSIGGITGGLSGNSASLTGNKVINAKLPNVRGNDAGTGTSVADCAAICGLYSAGTLTDNYYCNVTFGGTRINSGHGRCTKSGNNYSSSDKEGGTIPMYHVSVPDNITPSDNPICKIGNKYYYTPDAEITLSLNAPYNYIKTISATVGGEANSSLITVATPARSTASFTMPEADVAITASLHEIYTAEIKSDNIQFDDDPISIGDGKKYYTKGVTCVLITVKQNDIIDAVTIEGVEVKINKSTYKTATFTMPGNDITISASTSEVHTVSVPDNLTIISKAYKTIGDKNYYKKGEPYTLSVANPNHMIDNITGVYSDIVADKRSATFTMPDDDITIGATTYEVHTVSVPDNLQFAENVVPFNTYDNKKYFKNNDQITLTVVADADIIADIDNHATPAADRRTATLTMPAADLDFTNTTFTTLHTISCNDPLINFEAKPNHSVSETNYYAQGTEITLSYATPEGYTFDYFTANGSKIGGEPYLMPSEDITIAAVTTDVWGIKKHNATGSEYYPYVITTPAGLDLLATKVNSGTKYEGTYFVLGADIKYDGTENNFTAIGTNVKYFCGIFDGKYGDKEQHTISGININKPEEECQGLFGTLDGAKVQNIILQDAVISGKASVGGIVGYNHKGSVVNCTSAATIASNGEYNVYFGGIVGNNDNGTVSHCTSTATITSKQDQCWYFGGIVGETNNGTVSYCTSAAKIASEGNICDYYGGIVGSNHKGTVSYCTSAAKITSKGTGCNNYGGIVGENKGTVSSCTSAATINCSSYVGGIAGFNSGDPDSPGTLSDNLVDGATITATDASCGAIVGDNGYGGSTLSNNYYLNCKVGVIENATNVGCGGNENTPTSDITENNGAVSIHTITLADDDIAIESPAKPTYIADDQTEYYAQGTEITLSHADAPEGYTFDYFTANGSKIGGEPYLMPSKDITIAAVTTDVWGIKTHNATGSEDYPYVITTPAGLDLLATKVNSGTEYEGTYFVLGADIKYDGTENNFTAIGTSGKYFCGIFDGKYGDKEQHTISGININKPEEENQGLFGKLNGAKVQNIILKDAVISGKGAVGGIVGYNLKGSVVNCTSAATIASNGEDNQNFGGIVGYNDNGTVSHCTSTATITSKNQCLYFGGIVGGNNNGTVSYCTSAATISSEGNNCDYYGGIVGRNYKGTVSSCTSTATITSKGIGCHAYGGIVGDNLGTVSSCTSAATINGGSTVGGIAGENRGDSDSPGTLTDNLVDGATITATDASCGAIVGGNDYGSTLSNNYYLNCKVKVGGIENATNVGCGGNENTPTSDITEKNGAVSIHTITLADDDIDIVSPANPTYIADDQPEYYAQGTEITLSHADAPEGFDFSHYTVNGKSIEKQSFTLDADATVAAVWQPVPVNYIDENGNEKQCTDYTILTDGTDISKPFPGGWYVAQQGRVVIGGQIIFAGDAHLILADGADLVVNVSDKPSIVASGSLSIYGQDGSEGGSLNVLGSLTINSDYAQYGGQVDVTDLRVTNQLSLNLCNRLDVFYADKASYGSINIRKQLIDKNNVSYSGSDIEAGSIYGKSLYPGYVVTFDMKNGSEPVKYAVIFDGEGKAYVTNKPANPTRDGYTFLGWSADEECTTPFNFNDPITKNTTIYAQWKQDLFTLTINDPNNLVTADKDQYAAGDLVTLTVKQVDGIKTYINVAEEEILVTDDTYAFTMTEFNSTVDVFRKTSYNIGNSDEEYQSEFLTLILPDMDNYDFTSDDHSWYAVVGKVNADEVKFNTSRLHSLILCDNATLNASSLSAGYLNIYAQQKGSGALNVSGSLTITKEGASYVQFGGQVTVNMISVSYKLYLNLSKSTDFFHGNTVNSGSIFIFNQLLDDDNVSYSGSDIEAGSINGKTLRPGYSITIEGSNLSTGMTRAMEDETVTLTIDNDVEGIFAIKRLDEDDQWVSWSTEPVDDDDHKLQFTMPNYNLTLKLEVQPCVTNVSYIDADGNTATCPKALLVKSGSVISEGWYYVQDDVEVESITAIDYENDCNIILADNAHLTFNGEPSGENDLKYSVFLFTSLNIYAQNKGNNQGSITADNLVIAPTLTINGGTFTASAATATIKEMGEEHSFSSINTEAITLNGGSFIANGIGYMNFHKDETNPLPLTINGDNVSTFKVSEKIENVNFTLKRNFTKGINSTIMLPFDPSDDEVENFGGTFRTLTSVAFDENANVWKAELSKPITEVAANTPYIFLPTAETITSLSFSGVTIEPTDGSSFTNECGDPKWTLHGVYEKTGWTERQPTIYGFAATTGTGRDKDGNEIGTIAVGEFVHAGRNSSVRMMRAYLQYSDNATSKSALSLPDRIIVVLPGETASAIDHPVDDPSTTGDDIETPTSEINPAANVKVWSYDKTIYLAAAPNTPYTVIDLAGRTLITATTATDRDEIHLPGSVDGIVIVRIANQSFKIKY